MINYLFPMTNLFICKKRYGSQDRRGSLKNRVSIDEGPSIVDSRSRIGDWKTDTVAGTQTGPRLVTINERKTRYTLAALAYDKSANAVKSSMLELLKPHRSKVKTISYDNGKAFAHHEDIASATQSKAYFCSSLPFMGKRIERTY